MYYSSDFKKETQSTRFDRWRVNYDLLIRVIEAKESMHFRKPECNSKTISKLSNKGTI
jgi:hypothetical protein